jgi:hypothetical protein
MRYKMSGVGNVRSRATVEDAAYLTPTLEGNFGTSVYGFELRVG